MFSHVIFYVEDLEKSVQFFEKAFGIKARFVHESGQYAELETGQTALAFAAESIGDSNLPDGYLRSRHKNPPLGCEIALTVDDVQKAYEQSILKGAKALVPPEKKPWGQTVAYVRDPNGILVEIASPMG